MNNGDYTVYSLGLDWLTGFAHFGARAGEKNLLNMTAEPMYLNNLNSEFSEKNFKFRSKSLAVSYP